MYYLRMDARDKSGTYLNGKQKSKIKTYLQKKYDEAILKNLKFELQNLEKFTHKSENIIANIQEVYSSLPADAKQIVCPIAVSDEDYCAEWLKQEYIGKETVETGLNFVTHRGERVRSKSELNIANALYMHGIPYRYECPLILKNGHTIHPDFTVLNPETREEIYWEHRGMMDDREYIRHAVLRVKDYQKSGIYLGKNLIITEESSLQPLGTSEIEEVILEYFGERGMGHSDGR